MAEAELLEKPIGGEVGRQSTGRPKFLRGIETAGKRQAFQIQ
jgi:hypothetical protein